MNIRALALPLVLALSTAVVPSTAFAQEEVCQPFTQSQLDEFVAAVEQKVIDFQFDAAGYNLDDIQKQMRCMDTVVKPSTIARIARMRSLIAFFAQDEDKAIRWGWAQKHANAAQPWPDGLEAVPAYDEIWEYADDPTLGSGGAGVAHPSKGGVFLNGHFLRTAEYYAEVPGFVQIADKKGTVLKSYWQDGAAFDPEVIADAASDAEPPKWFVPEGEPGGPGGDGAAVEPDDGDDGGDGGDGGDGADGGDGGDGGDGKEPKEPKEKTPKEPKEKTPKEKSGPNIVLLGASGGTAVLAGTAYILSTTSHAAVRNDAAEGNIESADELASRRSFVNTMAIGSGVLAAGAVGIGVTAFIDAKGGGGLGITARF